MSDFENVTAPPPAPTGTPSEEERRWAMFTHLSAIAGAIVTGGWGFSIGCFIGPLIIWLLKKDTMPFVADQGKEALNFNITLAIVFFVLLLLTIVTLGVGGLIAFPLYVIAAIAWLVFTIIAAIKSNEGVAYRYPFAIRLIK